MQVGNLLKPTSIRTFTEHTKYSSQFLKFNWIENNILFKSSRSLLNTPVSKNLCNDFSRQKLVQEPPSAKNKDNQEINDEKFKYQRAIKYNLYEDKLQPSKALKEFQPT